MTPIRAAPIGLSINPEFLDKMLLRQIAIKEVTLGIERGHMVWGATDLLGYALDCDLR